MKLLSSWRDYLTTGRIRLQVAEGIELDTDRLTADAVAAATPQDTGWRRLTLESGVSSGNVFMRRRGQDVHLMMQGVAVTTAGHRNIVTISAGFKPQAFSGANWRNAAMLDDTGSSVRVASYYGDRMRILNAETSKGYGGYMTWITSDEWPATLPGTAA